MRKDTRKKILFRLGMSLFVLGAIVLGAVYTIPRSAHAFSAGVYPCNDPVLEDSIGTWSNITDPNAVMTRVIVECTPKDGGADGSWSVQFFGPCPQGGCMLYLGSRYEDFSPTLTIKYDLFMGPVVPALEWGHLAAGGNVHTLTFSMDVFQGNAGTTTIVNHHLNGEPQGTWDFVKVA